jgi:transcription termination factor Rho
MSTDISTIDPDVLGRKDRTELNTIASSMGIKGTSRLKKSELLEAILGNASAGAPAEQPKRISSKRASELAADSIEAIVAEEERLARGGDGRPDDALLVTRSPKPKAVVIPPPDGIPESQQAPTQATSTGSEGSGDERPARQGREPRNRSEGDRGRRNDNRGRNGEGENRARSGGADGFQDEFDEFGNRRGGRRGRNRGRGRDRERVGYDPQAEFQGEPVPVAGLLDLRDEGYGFLRCSGYLAGRHDVYVPAPLVRKLSLRRGDSIRGASRPQTSTEKFPALLRVDEVNGMDPEEARSRARFEDLTPLFPDSALRLELKDEPQNLTGRIIDLVSPIGKGQRGLIVSPPKAGKTTIMKHIVSSIERNNPEVHLMVLLVDERPEEVTDMRRHVQRGEVIASTFDRPSDEHTHVSELTIERAKRLVEMGKDVVIVLDGITRLARAYNLSAPASGRIMSGGVDSSALYPPKRFFRRRTKCGRRRLVDDSRHRVDRDRIKDGRGHLRRVQRHRKHGAPPRPTNGGSTDLPSHRCGIFRYSTRRVAVRTGATQSCVETPPSTPGPRRRRRP